MALGDVDPRFAIDRRMSMIFDFGAGHAIGTCSMQLVPYQRIQILALHSRADVLITAVDFLLSWQRFSLTFHFV